MEETVDDIMKFAKRRLRAFSFDDRALICEALLQKLYDVQADAQKDAYFEREYGEIVEE